MKLERLESHPALAQHGNQRAQSVQTRIADRITAFAGSMWFVYIHIAWFVGHTTPLPLGMLCTSRFGLLPVLSDVRGVRDGGRVRDGERDHSRARTPRCLGEARFVQEPELRHHFVAAELHAGAG